MTSLGSLPAEVQACGRCAERELVPALRTRVAEALADRG